MRNSGGVGAQKVGPAWWTQRRYLPGRDVGRSGRRRGSRRGRRRGAPTSLKTLNVRHRRRALDRAVMTDKRALVGVVRGDARLDHSDVKWLEKVAMKTALHALPARGPALMALCPAPGGRFRLRRGLGPGPGRRGPDGFRASRLLDRGGAGGPGTRKVVKAASEAV